MVLGGFLTGMNVKLTAEVAIDPLTLGLLLFSLCIIAGAIVWGIVRSRSSGQLLRSAMIDAESKKTPMIELVEENADDRAAGECPSSIRGRVISDRGTSD